MSEYTLTQIDFLNVIQGIQNNPQFSIFWLSLFVFKSLSHEIFLLLSFCCKFAALVLSVFLNPDHIHLFMIYQLKHSQVIYIRDDHN